MAPTVPIDFTRQKESRKCFTPQIMGKSRKYSKGHLSGFVPDYRHAVETMAESEGFGSSGRVDTEMTASEDSCTPKRKCISLNVDGYDGLGVPMQVLPLSRMSRSEKKDLELKLKMELEQVRFLQKKIGALSSNVLLSPSSDIRSCSDGKKRPSLESSQRSSGVSVPPGKKRAPPGRNGARTKKSTSGPAELAKPVAPATYSISMLMKQSENLLDRMMVHEFGWVFNEPVDVVKLNIPDYFTVIKHPMDLGTVKSKMTAGVYSTPLDFAADVRLAFSNAMAYNPPGNDVHFMAATLSKYFEQRWKAIQKKVPVITDVQPLPSSVPLHVVTETATPMPPSKKTRVAPHDGSVKPESPKRVFTDDEKAKMSLDLEGVLADLPESIVDFLKEHTVSEGQTGEDEIEIDVDTFSDDTLFALRKLLDNYLLEKQKSQEKAEPCEIEIPNESGFSNSSMQPCKGNDPVDEDVDIVGGNDAPISSFPPVEIEKDTAQRNSKFSSSSSSSSESGSSSSDSDSASSVESGSDVAKAPVSFGGGKEKLGSGANLDQKRSNIGGSEIGNHSIDGVAPLEQDAGSKPIPVVEEGGHREGESAPSEKQVSPEKAEKAYRAAVMRSRFADTILKAREKALEKGEKLDPEKLRIEREELEKQLKEEKARLQAEAKAAEDARQKAESEAAAEAKRQRELEREAARRALLLIEKTVEINENSRFMEDLDMFRAVDDEHVPNFTEEINPDHSPDELARLGSFNLQGSNPLEQLGLFMKADDDLEEEEIEPPQCAPELAPELEPEQKPEPKPKPKPEQEPAPESEQEPESKPARDVEANDVEEGEID